MLGTQLIDVRIRVPFQREQGGGGGFTKMGLKPISVCVMTAP